MTRKELKPHTIFRYADEPRLFYVVSEQPSTFMDWPSVPPQYHSATWSPSSAHSSRGRENMEVIILWEPKSVPVINDWGEDAL